jgi:hypothetical protein
MIAQLAGTNLRTVSRIVTKYGLQGRYILQRSSLQEVTRLHLTKRFWLALIALESDPKKVFTPESMSQAQIAAESGVNIHARATRKRSLSRLNRGKPSPRKSPGTNLNEGLSHSELALLACMLQQFSPPPEPNREPGRRVVS